MNYWEFLIQKEGDRTWLPLETQQVEVLAGRYRIAAHTDRTDTPLAIRLSPIAAEALPSDSEVAIRTTDESGLVLVLPCVHLAPGQWLLECSSLNPTNGLTGEEWHHSTQFQVHTRTESGTAIWPASRTHHSGADHSSDTAASVLMGSSKNANSQQINKDLPLIQAQAALAMQRQSTGEPAPDLPPNPTELAYQVSLSQRAYLAQHNQPTTIIGKVNPNKLEGISETASGEASELWIRLQDPQTAQVIMAAHRPLSLARLPADFKVQIQLPAEVSTRIILGEVSLRSAATPDTPTQLLASTAFTITAGIAHLLAAIAHQETDDFEADVSSLPASTEAASTQTLAKNPVSASPSSSLLLDPTKKDAAPAVGVILPPHLNQENWPAPGPALSQPELPAFPQPQTAAPSFSDPSDVPPPTVSQPAQFIGTSILDDDLEADEITAVLENIGFGSLERDNGSNSAPPLATTDAIQPLDIIASSLNSQPDDSADIDSELSPQKQPKQPTQKRRPPTRQTDIDFQSLQLKNHFWQRLSTLTHDSHKEAAKMAEGMKAAGVSRESFPWSDELDLDLEDEVVIFDDPPAVSSQSPAHQPKPSPAVPLADTGDQPSYALAAQPPTAEEALSEMALPVISVPMGDLVAGEFITVTVRTRPSAYRPFIKLWMVDRQSRSLVMEPQRLTNLRPDALGDLQATAKLQIPMDCLDVQIAAIAIDMATQQESGKAVVNRHVVPADQSSPLRSFNL